MVPALLILSFLLVHLADEFAGDAGSSAGRPWLVIGSTWGVMTMLWLIAHLTALAGARMVDRGRFEWARRVELVITGSRILAITSLGVALLWFGLLDAVREVVPRFAAVDRAAAVLPLWLLIAGGWASQYEIDRRIREALFYRSVQSGRPMEPIEPKARYLWLQIRHQLLMWAVPLCLISGAGQAMQDALAARPSFVGWLGPIGTNALQLFGSLAMFLVTPVLVRRIWRTTELGEGELRERIITVCRAHRVRVRGPFVWRTGASVLNAAVLGLVYPARYLVFTDALLETLTPRQLEAVTAHEVAHLRLLHMLWLGIVAFAAIWVASLGVTAAFAAAAALFGTARLPNPDGVWFQGVLTLVVFAAAGVAFCFASRRFEWQADAFAAKHLSSGGDSAAAGVLVTTEAASAVAGALTSVAYYNGISEDRFQWRHGSIADRRRRVLSLVGLPAERLPIDRASAVIRWTSVAALVGVGAIALYQG
ncbi:MAG: M48 family metallopeptidase [Phycisphaerales bacterium]